MEHPSGSEGVAFLGQSATANAMRLHDWSGYTLGPPHTWPSLLLQMVNMLLASPESQYLVWGDEMLFFSNDAYRPILGPRLGHAIGTTLPLLWPDAFEAVRPSVESAFRGDAVRYVDEPVQMARHGVAEDTWWTFSFSPVFQADGVVPAVLCHTVETTGKVLSEVARRQAERRLTELNENLEREITARTLERNRIWEVSRDMLLVSDRQGVLLNVNPAWSSTLGWSASEMLGRTSEWLEHPDDRERTRAEREKLAHGETTSTFENRFRTASGEYRQLAWTAVPKDGLLYCVARDITEEHRRNAELQERTQTLRESEARARAYFRASPEYLLLLRVAADGSLSMEDINPSAEYLIGQTREDVRGRAPRDVLPEASARDIENACAACLRTGLQQKYAARRTYPGRREISVETVVVLVERREDGNGLLLLVARDRTEQRDAEELLRHAQKMEAVGQLTGGLAHDFNNLLSTISTSLELLKMRMPAGSADELHRYIATAARSVRSAAALTHRLLAFSRKQSLDLQAVDVNRLTGSLEEMLQRTLGEQISLEVSVDPLAWAALTDANQLENAILNLAINARDAMPRGGRLTIETSNLQVEVGMSDMADVVPGDYLVISVSDTGIGMSEDVAARAFDPFFTTKGIGQGSGLGLSMIYGYAKQSGGHVSIFSRLGEGTTIKLFLPRAAQAGEVAEPEAIQHVEPGRGKRILLVEDNTDLRGMIVDALTLHGYDVTATQDAMAALDLLDQTGFDLLVTDVGLPGLSGRELADLARQGRPELPILMISGYAKEAAVRANFVGAGMDLLSKPFALHTLSHKVGALLRIGNSGAPKTR